MLQSGDMPRLFKKISVLMVIIFAMLLIMEVAGVRIHHDDSIDSVNFSCNDFNISQADQSKSEIPCQGDETPIEHVIHNGASSIFSGNKLFLISTNSDILPPVSLFFFTSIISSYLFSQNRVDYCCLISNNYPDRAPPVSL